MARHDRLPWLLQPRRLQQPRRAPSRTSTSQHASPRLSSSARTTLSFNTLLSCYNRSRKHLRLIPSLFADLSTKHSIAPNEISYDILVKSLCRPGGTQKALPILQQMESKNINLYLPLAL